MKRKTEIKPIFGQINGVVAHQMALEGKVTMIPAHQIPPTVLFNDEGERASCALVFTPAAEREFDQRCAALRA